MEKPNEYFDVDKSQFQAALPRIPTNYVLCIEEVCWLSCLPALEKRLPQLPPENLNMVKNNNNLACHTVELKLLYVLARFPVFPEFFLSRFPRKQSFVFAIF